MKKLTLLVLGLVIYACSYSQHVIKLKHKQYETHFDTVLKYPVLVTWWVTKKSLSCTVKYPRTNKFVPDPVLYKATDLDQYYVGSGYDRGHNFPAADAACDSTSMRESFFFSNMTPQHPSVNRGDWKDLEEFIRSTAYNTDSIKIWAGSWGVEKKIGRVSVPTDCWKVIYIVKKNQWLAYHFKNTKTNSLGIKAHEVPLSFIESKVGFKFKK